MVTHLPSQAARRPGSQTGFSLVELLVALLVSTASLGAAAILTDQISRSFTSQLDDALVQEEARFTLQAIERVLRSAGSNPYRLQTVDCPAAGTPFQAVRIDPNGDTVMDDIRVQADINPPNGRLGGAPCASETGEDVTIAYDPVTRTITRLDNNVGGAPAPITDTVITQLGFTYLDANRLVTADPAAVASVQIAVTAQAPNLDRTMGQRTSYTLTSEVRLRAR